MNLIMLEAAYLELQTLTLEVSDMENLVLDDTADQFTRAGACIRLINSMSSKEQVLHLIDTILKTANINELLEVIKA